jgi:two-component system, NtrC family, C4-dicarboxylate transport sensor histidine kinase DctB
MTLVPAARKRATRWRPKTAILACAACAVIALSAAAAWHIRRETGLQSLEAVNAARIELIASALRSEINRQDHLPLVLSLDADVRNALARRDDFAAQEKLRVKLQRISDEADTRALYVIGKEGRVVAAGQSDPAERLVGGQLGGRSYFLKAIESGRSSYLGLDPLSRRMRYYLAESITTPELLGVAVVRIEFDALEATWERSHERVIITDADGVVFLASAPSYRYRAVQGAAGHHLPTEAAPANFPAEAKSPIEISIREVRGDHSVARILDEDESVLYQRFPLNEFGWTIHRFVDLGAVESDQRDGAIIAATLSALLLSLLLYLVQRQRAYAAVREAGARLAAEVTERTRELRDANALLRTEVDERRRTEDRLRTTQNELLQAGKLAALGQMSAAIAHEVNQPLAAMRTFMASAKIYLQRGDQKQVSKNLDQIDGLAERMAKVTHHLKTFARKSEPGRPEPVQVGRAIEGALFLTESQIKNEGVELTVNVDPDLQVSGYAVQLEQVLVNLIRNALDALTETKDPTIRVDAGAVGDLVRIRVADNGSGIPPELIDRIFDPFVSTKSVGKGLGLGLSITYGIVQDFHGRIHAVNRAQGGAEIIVELPRLTREGATAEKTIHA